jgi:hypothetical protein
MDTYISNLQKEVEHKYLLALRKKTYIDGLITQQEKLEELIKEFKQVGATQNLSDGMSEIDTQKDNLDAINQFIYNKSWNKLALVHKILKIKEYVNKSLSINNEESKKKLIDELVDAIKNKRLSKKDQVNYDEVKAMVISVPSLKHNNGKFYLQD